MAIPSKKMTTIGATTLVLLAAGGTGGFFTGKYISDQNHKKAILSKGDVKHPEFKDTVATPRPEATLPSGTISPSEVTAHVTSYVGKKVKVRGLVVEVSVGKFIISGQDEKKPSALPLIPNKNTSEIAQFANTQPTKDNPQPQIKNAVTISGTIQQSGNTIALSVDSIEG